MSAGTSPPPLPRKPRNWLPTIIVVCFFTPLLILLIGFISYRVSNASAVRRLEAEIKRKGEPLTLADLAATYPPIPDEENGAVLLVELWKKEDPEFWNAFLEGVRPLPTRREPKWNDALPILGAEARRISRTTELSPENVAAAEAFLDERREYFEKMRQALSKPKFRFPIAITDGYGALLPHLVLVKQEAQAFHIEVLVATEHGDVDGAITSMESIARVGDSLATEPLLISQLVRIACFNMRLEAIERLCSRRLLSASQLERLVAVVNQSEMQGALRRSFVSERASMLSVFDLPEAALAEVLSTDSQDGETAITPQNYRVGMTFLGLIGLSGRDRRLMLETMGEAIRLTDQGNPDSLKKSETLFGNAKSKASRFPPKMFSALLLPSLEKVAPRFARLEARHRAASLALAVERFRLANGGNTPESLNELIPQFLSSIPSDPFDGQPLRYKELPTGFVVYSIGPDRTDDGGIEPLQRGRQKNFDVTFVVER